MALVYVGALSLAALCPVVTLSIGDVGVALNASFQGNLAVNASFSVSPLTPSIVIAGLAQFQADLTTAIGLGMPDISFDASMAANLIASLNACFGQLVALNLLLGAAIGIFSYSYVGNANLLGGLVGAELASQWPDGTPSSGSATALLFGAVDNGILTPPDIATTCLEGFLDGLPYSPGLGYGGKLSLAELSLNVALAAGQGESGIQAQLDGALALQAALAVTPPTLAATLDATLDYQAEFVADVDLGLALPSIQFALDATANAAADLSAKFSLLIDLGLTFSRPDASLFVYSYTGAGNALGAAIASALATTWGDGTPTSGPCVAALLGATTFGAQAAMASFFGGA